MISLLTRILCLIIGYGFGNFQTGYIYGRTQGIDIRQKGSGNSGTTNALRVMGKKAGAIVFLGDVAKLGLACGLTLILFNGVSFRNEVAQLICLYTGWGVVLGHNYPCYLHFKGGKGIAATACMLLILDWRIALIALVVFVGTVLITRYVSLGSILVVSVFFVVWVIFGLKGMLTLSPAYFPESVVLVFLLALLGIWRHRTNITRLLSGTENKLF